MIKGGDEWVRILVDKSCSFPRIPEEVQRINCAAVNVQYSITIFRSNGETFLGKNAVGNRYPLVDVIPTSMVHTKISMIRLPIRSRPRMARIPECTGNVIDEQAELFVNFPWIGIQIGICRLTNQTFSV